MAAAWHTEHMASPEGGLELVEEPERNLHLTYHKKWLAPPETESWWNTIMENVSWFRVKYKSARFGNDCETPCWTTFYGGDPMFTPYEPVPAWLQPLVDQVTAYTGAPANAMLLRLYFDGADEIAWHTDGRTFLGPTPTIASLSFGAEALFQMRRMRNVWPCAGDNGIDATTPIRDFPVGDGEKEAGLWRSTLWRAHHTTPTPTTRHAPGHERRHPEALAPSGPEGKVSPTTHQRKLRMALSLLVLVTPAP